ncbi:MAG: Asp-tRNA(Asn)/Glu-tRNA(Gln) amidotransferase subunit GatC [Oscillospiraceae bacterium]|nr:Asp-tRNA(Asn)/Glu-tRNA(Gln) amidotransferase subunit GatC [Oscillospiraceae bacterium]
MNHETLRRLTLLNQLSLTDAQKEDIIAFFARQEQGLAALNVVDTESVERMVHVMPILTVVREDVAAQPFTREALQSGAPDAGEGYWRVPRVVE